MILRISAVLLALLPSLAWGVSCKDIDFDGKPYSVCKVDVITETLRLFLYDDAGAPIGNFSKLPKSKSFAMNAGMFHGDRRPVGYYVEDGKQFQRIVTSAGPGNFGMMPNGVFCIQDGRADVIETHRFAKAPPACNFATQSGPMLVMDGALHPRFIPDSPYLNIRNAVGTTDDGTTAYFAISNRPVHFHEFARLFRDYLNVDQALYFDGRVSRLYSKQLNRSDFGTRMGPIVAVVD